MFEMNQRLLHPSDKLVRLPLVMWAEKLLNSVNQINSGQILLTKIEDFAIAVNQASLVLAFCGKTEFAKIICHNSINFYATLFEQYPNNNFLLYQIQSWINIARLERILKQYDNALNKFMFLLDADSMFDKGLSIFERDIRKVIAQTLARLNIDEQENHLIPNVPVVEITKTYLEISRYKNLLEIFPVSNIVPTNYMTSIITEGQIVALSCSGFAEEALHLLRQVLSGEFNLYKNIFIYRQIELAHILGDNKKVEQLVLLVNAEIITDDDNMPDLNRTFYMLEFANLLIKIKNFENAFLIYKRCYIRFLKLQDEVGQFLSLRCLTNCFNAKSDPYKMILYDLRENTKYISLRNGDKILSKNDEQIFDNLFQLIMTQFKVVKISKTLA